MCVSKGRNGTGKSYVNRWAKEKNQTVETAAVWGAGRHANRPNLTGAGGLAGGVAGGVAGGARAHMARTAGMDDVAWSS